MSASGTLLPIQLLWLNESKGVAFFCDASTSFILAHMTNRWGVVSVLVLALTTYGCETANGGDFGTGGTGGMGGQGGMGGAGGIEIP